MCRRVRAGSGELCGGAGRVSGERRGGARGEQGRAGLGRCGRVRAIGATRGAGSSVSWRAVRRYGSARRASRARVRAGGAAEQGARGPGQARAAEEKGRREGRESRKMEKRKGERRKERKEETRRRRPRRVVARDQQAAERCGMARKKKREGTGGGKRWNDNGKRMSGQRKFGNWVLSSTMKNFENKLASDLISKFFRDVTNLPHLN